MRVVDLDRCVVAFVLVAFAVIVVLAQPLPASEDGGNGNDRLRMMAMGFDEYACCLPTGVCAKVADEPECDGLGGAYQGDGSQCALVECPQPGACCLPGGTCTGAAFVGGPDCLDLGGVYQGDDTACGADECERAGIEKGSLLIFPRVELRWDAAGGIVRDTFLSITNDFPADVSVLFYFVNGDPPLAADPGAGERAHPGWNWVDIQLPLTGNQPTYWSALTGQPAGGGVSPFIVLDPGMPLGVEPGRPAPDGSGDRVLRGFVLGWAVDAAGQPIRWNHLSGVMTEVDYRAGTAWEVPTLNHAVVSDVAHGEEIGAEPGVLELDGVTYQAAFGEVLVDFQAVGSAAFSGPRLVTSDTELTLLPLDIDVRQETTGPITTDAVFDVWNMNEVKFSGARRCVSCWDTTAFGAYDPPNHFRLDTLQTDHGALRVDGRSGAFCSGEATALWALSVRRLKVDAGLDAAASAALPVGAGLEAATIRFDPIGDPDK